MVDESEAAAASEAAEKAHAPEEPALVAEKAAPVAEKTAPVPEEPALVAEKAAAVAEEPALVAEKAAPVPEEPAPVAAKPAPLPAEPAPVAASAPPVMTRIQPASGPLAGGTRVVVEGTGFVSGCEVKIDRVQVAARFESATALSFDTLPRNLPGRVDVDLVNPDGQRTMLLGCFEYCLAPELASIAPAHAPETGGGTATLTGTNLREGSEVRIGAARPRVEWRGPTRIDVEIPAHPAGTYDVELVAPDGQQARLAGAFRFDGPPRVDRAVPDHGPHDESTRIAIEGEAFRAGCAVYADGARVAADVESPTRLVATLPARAEPGAITLRVQNADGLGAELREAFRYDPPPGPRITLVSPVRVPRGKEHPVAVTGTGFAEGCSVRVAGEVVPSRRVSAERIELTLPPLDRGGFVDVEVRTLDGRSARLDDAFELRGAPVVSSVHPREGSQVGGIWVTVNGTGFERGCDVLAGGVPARADWESDNVVRFVSPARPAGTGLVDVTVRNPDGQAGSLAEAFRYLDRQAPVVTSIAPSTGPTTGGTGVLVKGEHLDAVTQVLVGGERALNFKARGGELAFVTPPRARDGAVDIELRTGDGASTVRKNSFQYTAVPPPAIRSISPNRCAVAGGTEMTILGDNFFPGSRVLVDGEPVATVKVRDKGTIVFTAPRGEEGAMVDVVVRSATGQEAVAKRAFLYDPRYR